MATIDKKLTKQVRKLYYDDKLSVREVANRLDVSMDAVFYCMRRNGLNRRKKWESNSIRYERLEPSFKLQKIKNEKLRTLKAIGTMLYWGEGCKSDKMAIVDFANSDKDMIIIFLKFLRKVCGVNEKKLRVFPYFHANQNTEKNIDYWSNITKIKKDQFTKPYVRETFNNSKKDKMPHGLIHIRYGDKKLLNLLKNWIDQYKKI